MCTLVGARRRKRAGALRCWNRSEAHIAGSRWSFISSGLIQRSESQPPGGRPHGGQPVQFFDELRHDEAAGRKRIRIEFGGAIVCVLPLLLRFSRVKRCLAEYDQRFW